MATVQRRIVHKQFNSPIGLYSDGNIKETLDRDLKLLSNGAVGIEFQNSSKPANLANSAVLRMLEEEEAAKIAKGLKKVAWPPQEPPHTTIEQQPQEQANQYQPQDRTNYQQVRSVTPNPNKYYHQQPQQQEQNHQQQPNISYYTQSRQYQTLPNPNTQNRSTLRQNSQPPPSSLPQKQYSSPTPSYINRQSNAVGPVEKPAYIKSPYQSSTTSFAGGVPVSTNNTSSLKNSYNQSLSSQPKPQPPQAQPKPQVQFESYYPSDTQQPAYVNTTPSTAPLSPIDQNLSINSQPSSPRGWSHVRPAIPVNTGYTRQLSAELLYSQPQFGYSSSFSDNSGFQNQYQPQTTQAFRPVAQQQYQQYQQPEEDYQRYQPQLRHQQQQPAYNNYRQQSPGVITLRENAPYSQKLAPVFVAQPATKNFRGGSTMRGDQKWPPESVRTLAEMENEQRRRLAAGPAFRPRKAHKDYTQFFAQHALNTTYPGYKCPPGTQHYPN